MPSVSETQALTPQAAFAELSAEDQAKVGQPGWVLVRPFDGSKPRMVRWDEATKTGADIGSDGNIVISAPTQDDMDAAAEYMRATAPPVVKTSPQAKVEKFAALFLEDVKRREAVLGRPLQLDDFSDQWIEALRVDALRSEGYDLNMRSQLTTEHIMAMAKFYCGENALKLEENRGNVVRPF